MIIDRTKLDAVMKLIDEIADSDDAHQITVLETKLREITGKPDIQASDCLAYWSWTSLEELARTFLMPAAEHQGLQDDELAAIIAKICTCEYSESETDYQLKVLERETGLINLSDYIFYPDKVGLDMDAGSAEIIAKILADRKNKI